MIALSIIYVKKFVFLLHKIGTAQGAAMLVCSLPRVEKGLAYDIFDAFARHSFFNLKLLFFRTALFLVGNSGHLA